MIRPLLGIIVILLHIVACSSSPSVQENAKQGRSLTPADPFPEDSLTEPDTFAAVTQAELNDQQKETVIRLVMKGLKTAKNPDINKLEKQHLQAVYTNFLRTLDSYRDSAGQEYSTFFRQLYDQIQAREEVLLESDTLHTRTRLEIARIKSDIHTAIAGRTTRKFNITP